MRHDNWGVDSTRPRAAHKFQWTPAKDYFGPSMSKVPVLLEADGDEFMPAPAGPDGSVEVFANLPSGPLLLPRGGQAVVDCGFSLVLPPGFRCVVAGCVPGVVAELVDSKRFKVSVLNLGAETNLKHGEPIGRARVEPVYFFEWIARG